MNPDDEIVAELLGRRPQGDYTVVVRRGDGRPVVLENAPFLHSGRPMPTRYWLVDQALNKAIGQLESTGGVKQAEAAVDPVELQRTHDQYRMARDELIPADHPGPRPSGGVGGTRVGVKCLHTHYAHYLAVGDDPVGSWVHDRLSETGKAFGNEDEPDVAVTPASDPGAVMAVEIGSGAVKAVVESSDGRRSRLRVATNLGSELSADGLSVDGRANLVAAFEQVRAAGATDGDQPTVAVVATAALRQHRSEQVAALVTDYFGTNLEVLSGQREAELGLAALGAVAGDGPVVSFDVGYRSTELATSRSDGTIASVSLPIGAQTIVDTYLLHDPPQAAELSAALSVIELHLDDIVREHKELADAIVGGEIIGLGAVRFFAEVEFGGNEGDAIDGYVLDYRDVEEVFRILATESNHDRAANPGLRAEHVDVIVGGGCLIVEFMRHFSLEAMKVSTAGVVDGLVAELKASRSD